MFYIPYSKHKSPIQGQGLFPARPVRKGEKVFILDGPYITWHEAVHLGYQNHVIPVSPSLYHIGPENFVNHSCRPNLGFTSDRVTVALVDILPETEFTWDYSTLTVDNWSMQCACGEPNCRKLIGNYIDLPTQQRKYYASITPLWVKARYKDCRAKSLD